MPWRAGTGGGRRHRWPTGAQRRRRRRLSRAGRARRRRRAAEHQPRRPRRRAQGQGPPGRGGRRQRGRGSGTRRRPQPIDGRGWQGVGAAQGRRGTGVARGSGPPPDAGAAAVAPAGAPRWPPEVVRWTAEQRRAGCRCPAARRGGVTGAQPLLERSPPGGGGLIKTPPRRRCSQGRRSRQVPHRDGPTGNAAGMHGVAVSLPLCGGTRALSVRKLGSRDTALRQMVPVGNNNA